ncbi:YfhO family protein [Cohnella lupini]|uniref:Putative membrane protein YfhO n=1 Tax=Cohnella lupini TaxID=1294267 RepID=A0A3D9I7B3_9BACL|nr:YfhO family protein [Cohnella lupini]RED57637.1 putative membrane protein YfhO [Cohnella lupini]
MRKFKNYFVHMNSGLILIYFVLPIIFYYNLVVADGFWAPGDGVSSYVPSRAILKEALSHFSLPTWSSYVNLGVPYYADVQNSIFYLPNILFYAVFPLKFAYNYMFLFHLSLAGTFVFLYLKQIGINRYAAFVGGIAFMFCGALNVRLGHVTIYNAIIWLPLILFFYEKLIASQKKVYIVLMSLAFSMQIFAGFIQVSVYTSIAMLFYFLLSIKRYPSIKNWIMDKVNFSAIVIGVTAIQTLPLLQLASISERTKISYEYFSSYSLPLKSLVTIIFPYIFGVHIPNTPYNVYTYSYFGEGNLTEFGFYSGIIPVTFAVIAAITLFKKNNIVRVWSLLGIFCLIFALGSSIPFINKVMFEIPIINSFRVSARILFIVDFAIVVLFSKQLDLYFKENWNESNHRQIIRQIKLILYCLVGSTAAILLVNKLLKTLLNKASGPLNTITVKGYSVSDYVSIFSLHNSAVFIPLILMGISTIFLLIFYKYNRSTMMYPLILIILLDLHSFSFYHEKVTTDYNNTDEITQYIVRNNANNDRIWPLVSNNSDFEMNLSPNKNTLYKEDIISGYATFLPESYKAITGFDERGSNPEYLQMLLNNEIISTLNTRYIILNNEISNVINKINTIDLQKTTIISDFGKYTLPASADSSMSLVQSQVKIEPNTFYKFSVKLEKATEKELYIDLFGDQYDSNAQQMILQPTGLEQSKYFYSDSVVPEDVYFRIFSQSNMPSNIEYCKLEKVSSANNSGKEEVYTKIMNNDRYALYENKRVLQRMYSVTQTIKSDRSYSQLSSMNLHEQAIVDGYEDYHFTEAKVDITDERDGYIQANISADKLSFIVFSESFYPGWHAYVDGRQVPIYRVNGMLQGIEVDSGQHIIKFKFNPGSLKLGYIIWLVTLLYIFVYVYRKKLFVRRKIG